MLAVLFGSYSIPITVAAIPSFLLLKSIILYFFLAPPPRCLTVIFPWLLRPACLLFGANRDFSGVFFVISEKSEPVICLLEGVYGLYVLIPMVFLLSIVYYHGCFPYALSTASFLMCSSKILETLEDLDIFAVLS